MTAYADLDVSVIDELPPGRTPVVTVAMPDSRRDEVVERIRSACLEGRQAYWVCPLIEESDACSRRRPRRTRPRRSRRRCPTSRRHRARPHAGCRARDARWREFKAGEIELLVATTVIEVGVDVPNASLMVIENAERMGLAQLHQLRGRVGRGREASTACCSGMPPLSPLASERLAVLRETNDGFEVARRDLELRGPGELLGTRQTGLMQLKVADLMRDADLLPRVQAVADVMLRAHADNMAPLKRRWIGAGTGTARYERTTRMQNGRAAGSTLDCAPRRIPRRRRRRRPSRGSPSRACSPSDCAPAATASRGCPSSPRPKRRSPPTTPRCSGPQASRPSCARSSSPATGVPGCSRRH